jgi:hypothetical protein
MPRKRISIRIEHTEVTLSITEVETQDSYLRRTDHGEHPPPRHCPVCGSQWLPNLHDLLSALHLTANQLKLAATEGRLHLFCSPDDQVWVCERSIQQMQEAIPSPLSNL